jgi:hypothetical protein
MDRLAEWTSVACAELGIDDAGELDRAVELAREVAKAAAKPAAVVAAYLFGVAVGRGTPTDEAATKLTELARRWRGNTVGSTIDWRD